MNFHRIRSFARRCLIATTLAVPAQATWSIVVMNTATGEVIVAGATCLQNVYLPTVIGCVAVGKGGGASQAFVIANAKSIMFAGFHADKTPLQIFQDIQAAHGPLASQQFGIVGLEGPAYTHTGNINGPAATGVAGEVGSLRYSIQGNVLAQFLVVRAAEEALLNSSGDLGQRVMAAMDAATAMGGDGRCSCPAAPPCGQPDYFRRASATAFIVLSRKGDIDSTTCAVTTHNCTNGDYYGKLSKVSDFQSPDPVGVLRGKYEVWRGNLAGRPDHYKTEVFQTDQVIKADGMDTTTIDIHLVDVEGQPLLIGGQSVLVSVENGPAVTISAVTDNGNGTHSFNVTSGVQVGETQLRIVIADGVRDVQLHPDVSLTQVAPTELVANYHTVSASAGALIEFEVDVPSNPSAPYQLLGSASGTVPGTPFGGLQIPLNRDRFFGFTILSANGPRLPNSQGTLDGTGQASAYLDAIPGFLDSYIGGHCDFLVFQPATALNPSTFTNLVGIDVTP
jgi:hypothetical protein